MSKHGKKCSTKPGYYKTSAKSRGSQFARGYDDSGSSSTDDYDSSSSYSASSTYSDSDPSYTECSTCHSDMSYHCCCCCMSSSHSSFSSPAEYRHTPRRIEKQSCHGHNNRWNFSPKEAPKNHELQKMNTPKREPSTKPKNTVNSRKKNLTKKKQQKSGTTKSSGMKSGRATNKKRNNSKSQGKKGQKRK